MKITEIKIKRLITPKEGLVGFVSMVINGWLFVGNIAIYSRLNSENRIRLVFPQKKILDEIIIFMYPINANSYFELEQAVFDELNK